MARLRKIPYSDHHRDYMSTYNEGGIRPKLPTEYVFELRIAHTTLIFINKAQLLEAQDFFATIQRPSGRGPNPPFEHYWHIWYARLPKGVLKRSNRTKILKALENGLEEYF